MPLLQVINFLPLLSTYRLIDLNTAHGVIVLNIWLVDTFDELERQQVAAYRASG